MVKKSMKKLFLGLAAISAAGLYGSSAGSVNSANAISTSKNFFQPRAFSADLARELLMEGSKHRDSDGWYGEFSATAVYQRSFTQNASSTDTNMDVNPGYGLGAFPFWSGTNVMTAGSNTGNGNFDIYQFGLGAASGSGTTTYGSIKLDPLVYQAGADFMFIVGSSANEPCFFAKIKAPVTVYNINPQLTEVDTVFSTTAQYPAGALQAYTGTALTALPAAAATMTQAFAGNLPGGENPVGDFTAMHYGLINGDQSTGAKFGDIEMTAGYRFISNDDNSFSVALRAAAPTGGQATGQYLLEPIVGRGGNWGLGGYMDGHVKLWEGNNENSFQLRFIANAMHLFSADTVRSYDLIENGGGSKYLLVANYSGGAYNNQIQNLINFSTLGSTSTFGVEGDVAVSFTYVGRGWSFDLGYEFWGRSAETLEITEAFASNSYAILGRQQISNGTSSNTAYCQPTATINTSEPYVSASPTAPVVAITPNNLATTTVQLADLNVAGAEQNTALTSKLFTKVTYEWSDSDYRPHLGVMAEFEFSTSQNNALPQWGISLVGGVSF